MSTSAAVYIESLDTTVRINADGFPDSTGVALERIVKDGLLESFAAHSEYSWLSETEEDYLKYAGTSYAKRYDAVENVGFAFPADDSAVIVTTRHANGTYSFNSSENYNYVVREDGTVVQLPR